MNLFNFKSILNLIQKLPTEEASIKYFAQLRWGDTPICPYCECNKCYDINRHRYKCSKCLKIFTVKVGTIFEGSKIPMQKWIMACYLTSTTTKGISSIELAKEIGVTQKTAWFMAHRIREATKEELHRKMDNIVEVDETFVGELRGINIILRDFTLEEEQLEK